MDKNIQKGVLIGATIFGIVGFVVAVNVKGTDKEKLFFTLGGAISGAISGGLIGALMRPDEKKLCFIRSDRSDNKKPKKCWCCGPHGMVECPCGGHHLEK